MSSHTNPRYIAYAKAHGVDNPEEMFARDQEAWPGGCMCGFLLWMREQKAAFYKAHPEAFLDRNCIFDFAAWDRFLGVKNEPETGE